MNVLIAILWVLLLGFVAGVGGGVGIGFVLIRQIDKRIAALEGGQGDD